MLGLLSLLGDSEPLSFPPAGTHSRFGLHAGEEHREGLGQSPRIVPSCVVTALLGSGGGRRVNLKPWGLAVVVPGCVLFFEERRGGGPQSPVHFVRSFLAVFPPPSSGAEKDHSHECIGGGRSSLCLFLQAAARRRITIKSFF